MCSRANLEAERLAVSYGKVGIAAAIRTTLAGVALTTRSSRRPHRRGVFLRPSRAPRSHSRRSWQPAKIPPTFSAVTAQCSAKKPWRSPCFRWPFCCAITVGHWTNEIRFARSGRSCERWRFRSAPALGFGRDFAPSLIFVPACPEDFAADCFNGSFKMAVARDVWVH